VVCLGLLESKAETANGVKVRVGDFAFYSKALQAIS
jgi:hypothetical protein